MGLSSEQVSTDGFDWSHGLLKDVDLEIPKPVMPAARPRGQQQQHGGAVLRCPRCDSANTKFCYYNNYSRTQPRHFCKACRRHWTHGGTLRNVPVGGGRKVKRRPKAANRQSSSAVSAIATDDDTHTANNLPTIHRQQLFPHLAFLPDVLRHALLLPPPPPPPPPDYVDVDINNSNYLGSLLSLPPASQFSPMNSYDYTGSSYPFSTSSVSPSFYNFTGQEGLAEEEDARGAASMEAPWQMLPPPACSSGSGSAITTSTTTTTSGGMPVLESSPSSGYWGSCWDDLAGLLSPDLKLPPPPLP